MFGISNPERNDEKVFICDVGQLRLKQKLRLETLYHKKVVNVDGSIFLRKSPPFHIDKGNLGRTFYFLRKVSPIIDNSTSAK